MKEALRDLCKKHAATSAPDHIPYVKESLDSALGAGYAEAHPEVTERLALLLARIGSAVEVFDELRSFTWETLHEAEAQFRTIGVVVVKDPRAEAAMRAATNAAEDGYMN